MTKPTQDKETLREAVARAMRLSAPELQSGQVWAHITVRQSQVMADAAIATMQPEIDRRVAEERDAVAQWLLQQAGGRPSMFQDRNLSRQIAAREFMYAIQRGDHLTAFQQENSDA